VNLCEPSKFTTKIATNWGYPAFSEPQRGEIGRTHSLVGKNPCLMLCFSVIRFFLKPIQWLKRVKSTTGSTALKVIGGLFRHSRIWVALVVSTFWGYTKAPAKRECCYDKPWDFVVPDSTPFMLDSPLTNPMWGTFMLIPKLDMSTSQT